jgi:hypothetical protein
VFRRFALEIAQLVDTAALHGGARPHLADSAPQPCITIDYGEHWRPQAARDEIAEAAFPRRERSSANTSRSARRPWNVCTR